LYLSKARLFAVLVAPTALDGVVIATPSRTELHQGASIMQRPQPAVRILALAFLLFLSACGGGGGGGAGNGNVFALNGGSVSGAVSFTVPLQTYTFNAEADTAYIVSTVTGAGDIIITV
jgi:hypothetical protein